jgi:hypothetical protein
MVLKRMKRRHTPADAVAFCERVRALRPDTGSAFACQTSLQRHRRKPARWPPGMAGSSTTR